MARFTPFETREFIGIAHGFAEVAVDDVTALELWKGMLELVRIELTYCEVRMTLLPAEAARAYAQAKPDRLRRMATLKELLSNEYDKLFR